MNDRTRLEEAIRSLRAYGDGPDARLVLEAAEAHLATLPKTAMVHVWRVEWADCQRTPFCHVGLTRTNADRIAAEKRGAGFSCVKITGPHQQEVPAQ